MLPEKNEWHISKGNKQICKGGPYSNWYSESPADCALSTGSYSITCCDTRAKEGWSGGYVLIHGEDQKLCLGCKQRMPHRKIYCCGANAQADAQADAQA